MLTQSLLREYLQYDTGAGEFIWLQGPYTGKVAGTVNSEGYISICLRRKIYRAHRLAWLYMTGAWPEATVDHINRDRSDNRWANLRQATPSQQNRNRPVLPANRAGLKGVIAHKNGRFYARITVNGKREYSGGFQTAEEAHAAYVARSEQLFGEFAHAA